MTEDCQSDILCVPYSRTLLYLLLTIPLLCMMGFVAYVLFTYSYIFMIIYLAFFVLTSVFQSYCCHYQSCPYVGGFCPAVAGIILASFFAKLLEKIHVRKSKLLFDIFAIIASINLLGLIVFPLYWLFIYNIILFVGFLLMVMLYAIAFLLLICPVCATRNTCPGGIASSKLRRKSKNRSKEA